MFDDASSDEGLRNDTAFRKTTDEDYEVSICGVPVGRVYRDEDADPRARWFIVGLPPQWSQVYRRRRRYGFGTRADAAEYLGIMQSGVILAGTSTADVARA